MALHPLLADLLTRPHIVIGTDASGENVVWMPMMDGETGGPESLGDLPQPIRTMAYVIQANLIEMKRRAAAAALVG